jgi:hypothetical protein
MVRSGHPAARGRLYIGLEDGGTIRTVCWLSEYCLLDGVVGSKIHD